MGQLAFAYPGYGASEQEQAERSRVYRRHLDDLGDEPWLYAVAYAIKADRHFPAIAALRAYAEAYRPTLPMLPPARSPEQMAEDREVARRGLELIRAEAAKVGLKL